MLDIRLYMLQRITALIMAPLVIGHLVLMIYAVQGGLSASEILGRTQGSLWWALYYGLFVCAAAVHGAIGLRTIFAEAFSVGQESQSKTRLNVLTVIVFFLLFLLGMRAVFSVVII